jgi:alpha-tubulin suppressor-like RCC1 family protein
LRVSITELPANATTNAKLQVTAWWNGTTKVGESSIDNPFTSAVYNSNTFLPVRIAMSAEGRPQVWVNNVLAVDTGFVTNWLELDKSLYAFSFTGTTGAANNNFHTIKDVVIGSNGVLPPGLSLNPTTGVISGQLGLGTAVDPYVNITATNAAGSTTQLLKLDVSASNTLPGQRPATGTSLAGDNALGVTGEQFRNLSAFAALTTDGQVKVWGNTLNGGLQSDAPTGTGYTLITSNEKAFAALRNDGSIVAWGLAANGATGEPTGTGYQMLAASRSAFAAIKSDGSIVAWGDTAKGGAFNPASSTSPTGTGYLRLYANGGGFVAQKIDGTLRAWGNTDSIGSAGPPTSISFNSVTVNDFGSGTNTYGSFAGLKSNGITAWGSSTTGGTTGAPTGTYQDIVATSRAFAAIDSTGTIKAWGDSLFGGGTPSAGVDYLKPPTDSGYRQIYANNAAFVALRQDGSLSAWGSSLNGGSGAPTGTGYVQVFSTLNAFAALKADGSISVWGSSGDNLIANAPAGTVTGFTKLFSGTNAFAALKADGSVTVWGNSLKGGASGPTGTGWQEITSSGTAFVARRSDGTLYAWGDSTSGGSGAPAGTYLTVQSPTLSAPYFPQSAGAPVTLTFNQTVQSQLLTGIQGDGLTFTITSGTLPAGLKLDASTGWIYGNPAEPGTFPLTIKATGAAGSVTQTYILKVESSLLPNQRQGAGAAYSIGSGTEFANGNAYAGLTVNGSIYAWGNSSAGGIGAPTGTGYTQITSNWTSFAALNYDGSIAAWGDTTNGASGAPTGTGYKAIYSTEKAFAALKVDGSISAWGSSGFGGSGAPTGSGYTRMFANKYSFAAQKDDGSITTWGSSTGGGSGAPTGTGYTLIVPNGAAYAALKADGSITTWGESINGGSGAPSGTGYSKIFASQNAYAALRRDGSIAAWGASNNGGSGAPSGTGFVDLWSSASGFAALKSDGSLVSWGSTGSLNTAAPSGTGYTQVFSTTGSFAALKADGSIAAWGGTDGGTGAPIGTGYTTIYSNGYAFAALKADGSITAWGNTYSGGSGAPTGSGYTQIVSRRQAFAALKADGTVSVWGAMASGTPFGSPGLTAFASIENATAVIPARQLGLTGNLPAVRVGTPLSTQAMGVNGVAGFQVGAPAGLGLGSAITSGSLPNGVTLNVATGFLEGTPSPITTGTNTFNFTVTTYNGTGQSSQAYALTVMNASTTTAAPKFDTTKPIGYANYAVGQAASYDVSAVSTSANTVNYSRIAGTLPPGMTLQSTGIVKGTPTTPGTYQFTIAASDSKGVAAQTFTIKVSADTPNQGLGQYSSFAAGSSGGQGLNYTAYASLRSDGTIVTWGDSASGGAGASGVPTQAGFVQIAQTSKAFAALRYDGTIQAWGDSGFGATGAPTDSGFSRLFSNGTAFAALKPDGSLVSWGGSSAGGTGAPTGTGYTQIFTNNEAMVAMKADGSLTAWGNTDIGGSGAPSGTGYVTITSNASAFAALRSDGSITAWGDTVKGGQLPTIPTNNSYIAIYSNPYGFAALRGDGTITSWGQTLPGDKTFPGGNNFISVTGTNGAFAALKSDGTITAWGSSLNGGGVDVPKGTDFTSLYSTQGAFAALRTNGSITSWGSASLGGTGAPPGTGYTQIVANGLAFTALKSDGTVKSWGSANYGGTGKAPTTSGFTQVFSNLYSFTGQKADGSITVWGNSTYGGSAAPTGTGLTVNSALARVPYQESGTTGELPTAYVGTSIGADGGAGPAAYQLGAISQGAYSQITAGALPGGLSLNPLTGFITGTPSGLAGTTNTPSGLPGTYSFTITTTSPVGSVSQAYTLEVNDPLAVIAPNQRVGSSITSAGISSNLAAFAAIKPDGSLTVWGDPASGGTGAPTDSGYTQVFSTSTAFTALKSDGSLTSWGNTLNGGSNAPTGTGFSQVVSSSAAFAALKSDGSLVTWGDAASGGSGAPTGTGFTQVFANGGAFAALNAGGTVTSWGDAVRGGTGAPTGTGFTRVFVNDNAFAALKADGSITTWGATANGGTGAPTGTGFARVFATSSAFAALKADGSITAWGDSSKGGTGAPAGTGFSQIFSTLNAFAALRSNGTITAWGESGSGGSGAPTSGTYSVLSSTGSAFAALKTTDGSIVAWGNTTNGGTNAPAGTGFTQVYATSSAFAALKADGSITAWGDAAGGGTGAPAGTGFTQVFANSGSFAALKADGSITAWGNAANGGTGAPVGTGYLTVQTGLVSKPAFAAFPTNSTLAATAKQAFFAGLGAQGVGCRYEITVGSLPTGMTLDANTGVLSGIPAAAGDYAFIVSASSPSGVDSQSFKLVVGANATAPTITSAKTTTATVGTNLSFQVQVDAAATGITYAISKGTLPAGLTINPTTGLISGTAQAFTNGVANGGVYTLELSATNNSGTSIKPFTLTLNQAPEILTTATLNGTPGAGLDLKLQAAAFPAPTYKIISGSLPAGLQLSSTGAITGIANAASLGTTTLIIEASNGIGNVATKTFNLTMAAMPATALAISGPSAVVSGQANLIEVKAIDPYGNIDQTATGTVTLVATGAGSLDKPGSSGALTASLVNGVATFNGVVYKASADGETFTVTASRSGLSSPTPKQISSDVVATQLQIVGTPSTTTWQSGVAGSLSGLRLIATDADGRIDKTWLASGQSVRLSLTEAGQSQLTGTLTDLSLANGHALSDTDSSGTTITLDSSAIASDGSINLGALQLQYTNASGATTVPLALKAERLGGTGSVLTGTMASTFTSTSNAATNAAPVLNLDLANAPAAFTENGSAIAVVGAGASVSDADNSLQTLQVAITNVQVGDLLAVASTPSTISANYDASNGSLLIKAAANATPTLADFTSALLAVRYSNSSDNPNTTTRQIQVTANDGSGLANATVTANRTLTVTAVDDPTTLTNLAASIAATEDTTASLSLGSLVLSDLDSGDALQTLKLSVAKNGTASGNLSASNGPGVTVTGSNSAELTLQGKIADLNTYLQTSGVLSFTPASNVNGSHTLSFVLGSGQTAQSLASTTINVTPVNDPAVFSGVPASGSVARLRHGVATTLQSLIGATPITIADLDSQEHANSSGAGRSDLVLTVNNANLAGLGTGTYPSGVALTVQSSTRWIINGTVAQINGFIADPAITLQSVNAGAVTLDFSLYDGSNVAGGTTTAMAQFLAVSDPVINNPASSSNRAISAGYDESLSFLSITDPDAGNNPQTFTLTIGDPGNAATLSGLTDGNSGISGIQLIGTAAQINAQLADGRYKAANLGNSSLQLTLSNGLAPAISSTANFVASNPLPTLTQITTLTGAKEDQQFAISFSDLAAAADESDKGGSVDGFVVKTLTSGTLKIGSSELTATPWTAGTNDRITPTQNAYWTAASNAYGTGANAITAFTVTALDNSNGESITPIAVKVDVTAVNDAPTLAGIPVAGTVVTTGISSALADFTVADLDSNALTLTLKPVNGSLGGLTDADNNREGIQLSGTAAQINAAVAAATFTATTSGAAEIKLQLEDGGTESITEVYKLTANALNNTPSLSTPGSTRSITTGLDDALSYITVSDSDAGQSLTLTLTANGGTFKNLADADLNQAGLQLNGSVQSINAALAAGSFVANANGAISISASVTDGVIATPVSTTYTLSASNAAPLLTTVSPLNGANEDQEFTITAADLMAAANASDPGGSVTGFVVTSVDSAKGTLTIAGSAYQSSTNNLINADRKAVWLPAANSNGTISAAFQIKAIDDGGLTSNTAIPVSIVVAPVNDAPVANGSTYSLSTNEDTPTAGIAISTLLSSGRGSDLDNANPGIAITASTGRGTWQFSTTSGTSWTAVGTLSGTNALLLSSSNQVRYVPDYKGGETGASLSYHVWDGTDGSAIGSKVDTTLNGGSNAFSSGSNTTSVTVNDVIDPLTLSLSRATTVSNNVVAAGFTYQELDVDGVVGNDLTLLDGDLILDDPDSVETLTGVKLIFWSGFQSAEDRLELSGTTPSGSSILSATRSITVDAVTATVTAQYDVGDGTLHLTTASAQSEAFWQAVLRQVGYRNIDNSPSTGTRQIVMLADDARQTARLQMLRDSAGTPHFYEYVTATNLSWSSAETAANNRSYFGMSGYLARIKSGTENSLLAGLVPSGNDAWIGASDRSTEGTWKWISGSEADDTISGSDYTNWASGEPNDGTYFWSASEDYAVMDANGEWFDISQTSDHYLAEYSSTLSPAFTFSKNFNVSVAAGNDAPVLASGSPTLASINEDNVANSGQVISSFILSSSITDPDSPSAPKGIAMTGLNSGNGRWEFKLSGGANWQQLDGLTEAQSLLLTLSDSLRFVPDGTNATAASFTYRAWDQTSGTVGTRVDTSQTGASTAFSSVVNTASITVTAVNDAPVWTNTTAVDLGTLARLSTGDDPANAGVLVSSLVSAGSDPDQGSPSLGAAVVGFTDLVNSTDIGNWEVSTDNGSSWSSLPAGLSTSNARLLAPTDRLRFAPSGAVGGTVSLDLRLWVQSANSGTAGSLVNLGGGGGSTAFSTSTRSISATSTGITLSGTASTLTLTEGQTLSPGSGLTLSSGTLSSARVMIASGLSSGDVLAYTAPAGIAITGSYDASKGELLLSGSASSADYQAALRAVTFAVGEDPTQFSNKRQIAYLLDNQTSSTAYTTVTVTAVATKPELSTASFVLYQEGGSDVALHPNLILTDADDLQIASATVTISSGKTTGDLLRFAGASGSPITATAYNSATGVLSLSGKASLADYQAALRSITFENTSTNPTNSGAAPNRTITMSVTDANSDGVGAATSTPISVMVNVSAINSAPVLTAGLQRIYTEGGTALTLDAGSTLTISDADDSNLSGAVLEISSGYTNGDRLDLPTAIVSSTGINASWDANSHKLTLSSINSLADYTTALRAVTFSSSSDDPTASSSTRQITIQATDANRDNGGVASGRTASNQAAVNISLTATADAPVLIAGSSNASYTEAGAAALLAPNLTLSDVDDTQLTKALVSISSGFVKGDQLSFTAVNGIGGSYDATSATLTLKGTAPLADYQTVLRSIQFSSIGADLVSGSRSISWTVLDANSDGLTPQWSAAATSALSVIGGNQRPQLSGLPASAISYQEGDPALALHPGLILIDPDSSQISAATIVISAGFTAGDVLSLPISVSGISSSYNAATGVLSLSGNALLSEYQKALRAVSYSSTSPDPTLTSTSRTISVVVTDVGSPSAASSNVATTTVNVTPVNNRPTLTVLGIGVVSGTEDQAITIRYSDLIGSGTGQGQVADVDGTVSALEVRELLSGSLLLGSSFATATAYSAGSNAQINVNTHAYWIPPANANGSGVNALNAFTVVARDNGGAVSLEPRTVAVNVNGDQSDAAQITKVILPANNTYQTGQHVDLSVVFDRAVTVTTTGGTPRLPINLDTGSGASANYLSGSGSNTLVFRYTVRSGDNDPTGLVLGAAIVLNGGQISSLDDGQSVASGVTLPGVSSTSGLVVDGINDAPEVTSPITLSTTYREGDPAVTLNPALGLSDADSTTISSATARIAAGFTAGDVLSLSAQATSATGIQASWDANTATLTLAPSSDPNAPAPTLLNALKALRAVTYATSNDNPSSLSNTRTIEWRVSDSDLAISPVATGTFTITPVNDAPSFSGFSAAAVRTLEDITAEISFQNLAAISNASDIDGVVDAYVVQAVTSGSLKLGTTLQNATAWSVGNDTISGATKAFWTPSIDANGDGLNAFTVVARDNGAGSGLLSATPIAVSVDVSPVADIATITGFQTPASGTYNAGSVLKFSITFDRPISLDPVTGLPGLNLVLDGNRTVLAGLQNARGDVITNYNAGDLLTFAYTVADGDLRISSGIGLPTWLSLPQGSSLTNTDDGGIVDVNLTLPSANSSGVFIDAVRPAIVAIQQAPGSLSNRAVQTFRVTFSEPVSGVDALDFSLSGTGTANGRLSGVQPFNPINGNATIYDVSVAEISGLGRLVLELKSSNAGIVDSVGNPLTAGATASGSLEVDRVGAIGLVSSDDRLSQAEASNSNGVYLQGTVSQGVAGQQVDLLITDTQNQTTTPLVSLNSLSDGSWSAVVPKTTLDPLPSGSYTLTLAQGNAVLGTRNLVIDRDAPTLSNPVTDIGNNPFFTGGALLSKAEIANGLTIKGSTDAENGQLVSVRLGNITGSGSVTNHNWEVNFTGSQMQSLSEGTLNLDLSVADLAGNLTSSSNTVMLDTTALGSLSTISNDGWINIIESNQSLTINGTVGGVEDGQSVYITVGSRTSNPASPYTALIANSSFSTTVSASDLSWSDGGTYAVTVIGSDLAGNTFSNTKSVTADLVAPTLDLKLAVGGSSATTINDLQFQGPINSANTLNSADFTDGVKLSSVTSADATSTNVIINNINKVVLPTTNQSASSWNLLVDPTSFSLPQEGSVTVSATTTDRAGNTSSQNASITVDRAASVQLISPIDGPSGNNFLNSAEAQVLQITGTTANVQTDLTASVVVQVVAEGSNTTVSNTTALVSSGSWTSPIQNLSILSNGNYTIRASITDGAGNTATDSQAFSINTAPPTFTSIIVAADNRINASEAASASVPSLTGVVANAEDDQLVSVTFPGVANAPTRTLSTPLLAGVWMLAIPGDLLSAYSANNGSYATQISISNKAGNSATTTFNITVDTSAPQLTLNNPTDAQWGAASLDPVANPLTLTGTAQNLEPAQDVTVVINGTSYTATRENANSSNWSLALTPQALQRLRVSNNQLSVTTKDLAGNTSTLSQTFNASGVNATPPTILDIPPNRVINSYEGDLLISQFKADRDVTWSLENVDANLLQINPNTGGFSFKTPQVIKDSNPNNISIDNRSVTFTLVASDLRNNQRREVLTLSIQNIADTPADSFDQDGIAAPLEDLATNGRSSPGDLNNDGISDKYQANVTAVPWISRDNFQASQANPFAAIPNSFASLQADPNVRISSVSVVKPQDVAVQGNTSSIVPTVINSNTSGANSGVIVTVPYDTLTFRLESYDPLSEQRLDSFVDAAPALVNGNDLYPGFQVRQVIDLPGNGLAMNTYLKWNPAANNGSGQWYEFLADGDPNTYDNGAELIDLNNDGLIDRIRLTYTDGDPAGGDIDGLVNGIIDDPGMPALLVAQSVITFGGVGGNTPVSQYLTTSPPSLDFDVSLEAGLEKINSFFDLDLVRNFTTDPLTLTNAGNRITRRHLAYYATGAGATTSLTYNPITRRGARFYDISGDGVADFVGLALANGQTGDFNASNTAIRSISRAATADFDPVFTTTNNEQLRVAGDLASLASQASLRVKATLTSRGPTSNQIGFIVFDDGENADAILADYNQFRDRAQTLFSTLQSADTEIPSGLSFDREITLLNGQRIQFFEIADGSMDDISSLTDRRFSLINISQLLTQSSARYSSKGGVGFVLNLLSGDQGLQELIGNDQGIAPVLNFSGFTLNQKVFGTVVMGREASYDSITGFYRTVNAEGWVRDASNNLVRPGEADYAAAALRADNLVTELAGLRAGNRKTIQNDIVVTGENSYLAPYAVVQNNTFFAYASANPDGFAHFRSLGTNIFGLEDLYGGGDKDFDDLVLGFKFNSLQS